jgi:hypothetical protein
VEFSGDESRTERQRIKVESKAGRTHDVVRRVLVLVAKVDRSTIGRIDVDVVHKR